MDRAYRGILPGLRQRALHPAECLAVFVAGSRTRGWANATSDLDLHIVMAAPWDRPNTRALPVALAPDSIPVVTTVVDGLRWDIEYWLEAQVDQMFRKVSWREFDVSPSAGDLLTSPEVRFLERLDHAVALHGSAWLERRREQQRDSALKSVLVARNLHLSDLFVEDAVGQMNAGDLESAVLSAKLAFGCAIKALLAEQGHFCQSSKWMARQLRDTTQDVVSFDSYWSIETMQSYDPTAPQRWVEHVISICQKISISVTV
jgi:hypothetical protein